VKTAIHLKVAVGTNMSVSIVIWNVITLVGDTITSNVKVLCDVAVSRHYTFN
jgi:hypothetical protein